MYPTGIWICKKSDIILINKNGCFRCNGGYYIFTFLLDFIRKSENVYLYCILLLCCIDIKWKIQEQNATRANDIK